MYFLPVTVRTEVLEHRREILMTIDVHQSLGNDEGGASHAARRGPLLTIGVPVYNGAATLHRCLDALLAQTVQDYEIFISDNASSDGTDKVCAEYAARDARIRFFRHPELVPPPRNFESLLERAHAPFFMFAAADDVCAPTFIEKNIANLLAHPDAACSISKVAMWDEQGKLLPCAGTYPLTRGVKANLIAYLRRPEDNSRFYGVYRTEALRKNFVARNIAAADWLISALTLLQGRHFEVDEVLLHRELTPNAAYMRLVEQLHPDFISRLIPGYAMSRELLRKIPLRLALGILPSVLVLCLRSTDISPYPAARQFRRGLRAIRGIIRRIFGR